MLMPLPGGLIPNDPYGGLIPGDPHAGRRPSDPPKGRIPGSPAPGGPAGNLRAGGPAGNPRAGGPAGNAYPASPRHGKPRRDGRRKSRREGPRGSPPGGMGGGFLPAPPAGLLPGDPLGDPLSTDPASNPIPGDPPGSPVHATPAPPGLNPGMVATITAQCPGLRVGHVLRHGGKSVLAGGYVGEQPVVIKMPGDTDPLWRLRQRHEIDVYRIFAEHPPPVRVPRLLHTDGESIVVIERLEGTPLDTGRYPDRPLTEQEIYATTRLVRTLHDWQPLPGGFGPVFGYYDRIARYHAAGYFADSDRHALDRLLARCGRPNQLNHGDLLPGNIISTPDGEWALLDWEFTGLFLPGFDLAMLQILLAASPATAGHIEALVDESGDRDAYLVNLAVVLSRERHIHHDLPEDHPLRLARLPALEEAWRRARDRIHAAAAKPAR
jgi:phosphotransferase family enzyme